MIVLTFFGHTLSSCKYKCRKCTLFYLQDSGRVETLFLFLVLCIYFLRCEVLKRVCIRVAYRHIKERRLFFRSEVPSTDNQLHIMVHLLWSRLFDKANESCFAMHCCESVEIAV